MTTARSSATSSASRRSLRWPARAFAVAAVAAGSLVGLGGLAAGSATAATVSPVTTLAQMQALNTAEAQAFGNQLTVVSQPALNNMAAMMMTSFQTPLNTINAATIAAQVSSTQSKLSSNIQAMNQAVQTSTLIRKPRASVGGKGCHRIHVGILSDEDGAHFALLIVDRFQICIERVADVGALHTEE